MKTTYLIFKKFEPDSVIKIFGLTVAFPALLSCFCGPSLSQDPFIAFVVVGVTYNFLIIVYAALYRLSPLHPLSKYPGPMLHKLTSLRTSWVTYQGTAHIHFNSLHEYYGDVVRVGKANLKNRRLM
jgi:hypothetical protein